MIDSEYMRAFNLVESTSKTLNKIYTQVKNNSFEDIKACEAMEKLIQDIDIFMWKVNHYSKSAKEGVLKLGSNDRYSINEIELTCGYPLEVYNAEYDQWEAGCVEHSNNFDGYYFQNNDGNSFALSNGMYCRVRK
ncbi:DUF5348 domain-containing protein [Clostridium manihotivorum]|uniref:DUF5348 domain-containing protein n=1 Tax=Clostridium manihotivorum TaxID=2320868 RepID=A0A410DMN2_9CLOT|nr:DUF5348 domain-containing protein [Clostridium manihotivorum]QAA30323.1 hypothetical protein C1I91_00725 [Clostridium manihotivorum]